MRLTPSAHRRRANGARPHPGGPSTHALCWVCALALASWLTARAVADEPPPTPRRLLGARVGLCEHLTLARGHLYFAYDSADAGKELWVSDGTPAGTRLLTDAAPGPSGRAPDSLTPSPEALYWTATSDRHGRELWRLDLTTGAAALVYDLRPGPASKHLL
jgi:ELWxxDGT repeat protein